MQFVDRITPTNQQYQDATVNYSQRGSETTRQRANDWATMYYQNAYNTAMTNYMNEYNSPLQQMLRYQEAGLNPNLAAQDPGNMGSAPSGAAPRGSADRGPRSIEMFQQGLQTIQTMQQAVRAATDIYDYFNYGEPTHMANYAIARYNADSAKSLADIKAAEADWAKYWNYRPGAFVDENGDPILTDVTGSPRAKYMQESTSLKSAQIAQLDAMVQILYPSQAAQAQATAALKQYQKAILSGQNDAILQIHTGDDTADAIFKMLAYKVINTSVSLKL